MHYRLLYPAFHLLVAAIHYLPSQYQLVEFSHDSTYAAQLGADDYGMKPYVMAFLKAGPDRSQDKETAAALQKAHLREYHADGRRGHPGFSRTLPR